MIWQLQTAIEVAVGLVTGYIGWALLFPLRAAYNNVTETLGIVKNELSLQRTNCLQTIQNDGKTQITVLNKMADTLESMHTGQSELYGYLKGINAGK